MKKIVALFTMGAFIIFSLSCSTTKSVRLDPDAALKVKRGEILGVVMTSGETIEFSKEEPGRIDKGSITGRAVRVTGELDREYIKGVEKDEKGKIVRTMVYIPLSEVMHVGITYKKLNIGLAILGVIGLIGIVTGVVLYAEFTSW